MGGGERAARGTRAVPKELRAALEHAARNIRRVAEAQLPRSWSFEVERGVRVSQRVAPIDTIGCYIPGGRFSLVSTLLMTAIPAQVAGVRRIVVACPHPNAALLAVAEMLGLEEIPHIGGAQAIAAFAYGTRSVPRVDKIFGPGNRYVTAAKRLVSADCAIDMLAGPTELLVVATRGNAEYIAADLLAQAEHDPDAMAMLVTTSRSWRRRFARRWPSNWRFAGDESGEAVAGRKWRHFVGAGFRRGGAFCQSLCAGASEHSWRRTQAGRKLDAAGSVFLGPWSAQSIGDYASGTNHVLPTGGGARTAAGFPPGTSCVAPACSRLRRRACAALGPWWRRWPMPKGLVAHRRAVEVRR